MNTPDLDAELLAARHEPPSAATMDVALMLAAEVRAASAGMRKARRPHRRAARIGVFAVGFIGLGALTGAGLYAGTHTGIFGNPSGGLEGISEYLNFQKEDFPDAVRAIAPDYVVYPGGTDPDAVANLVIADAQATGNGRAEESGLIANFEGYAYCSWAKTWVAQVDAGNAQGTVQAALHFRATIQYPATVAADAGGVIDHKVVIADAADRGDRVTVQDEIDHNCRDWGMAGQP